MEQNLLTKNIWSEAGKSGLVLGLISIAYMFFNQIIASSEIQSAFLGTAIIYLLWLAKLIGCIWLMRIFMKNFSNNFDINDARTLHRFGRATALLSALLYAGIAFANTAYISADLLQEQLRLTMEAYSGLLDSNSKEMMEEMSQNLPQMTFFSNLIYCFVYGTVLSLILSRTIPSDNPFEDNKIEEQ